MHGMVHTKNVKPLRIGVNQTPVQQPVVNGSTVRPRNQQTTSRLEVQNCAGLEGDKRREEDVVRAERQ